MGSMVLNGEKKKTKKGHAVLIPYPAQGHVTPMLKVAKILHSRGFYITFVNTEYNHRRLVTSRGPEAVKGLVDFRFETIPDGLPPSEGVDDGTQDIPALCDSTVKNCLGPFRELLGRLAVGDEEGVPPLTCVVSDGCMSFTLDAAEEFGVPEVLFWTTSACGLMAYLHYKDLVAKGITPFKTSGSNEGSIDASDVHLLSESGVLNSNEQVSSSGRLFLFPMSLVSCFCTTPTDTTLSSKSSLSSECISLLMSLPAKPRDMIV